MLAAQTSIQNFLDRFDFASDICAGSSTESTTMRGCAVYLVTCGGQPWCCVLLLCSAPPRRSRLPTVPPASGSRSSQTDSTPYRLASLAGNSAEAWASPLQQLSLKKEAIA